MGLSLPNSQPESEGCFDQKWSDLKRKWAVYRPHELKQKCQQLGSADYLIKPILPERSLGLIVGDSGIGKSPLLYQAALCVAAGIPFLNLLVCQGRVLYLDFENGLGQVDEILSQLQRHLALQEAPSDLILWNMNDTTSRWGQAGHDLPQLVKEIMPKLVVIDPLAALYLEIEEKNSNSIRVFQSFRKLSKETGTAFLAAHHLRKPATHPQAAQAGALEDANLRQWFLQARGAGALINSCDIRIGVEPGSNETALTVRGFGRVRGEFPTMFLERVVDEGGEPLGYRRMTGARLLSNSEQETAFAKLPNRFHFKDAQQIYGKGAQASIDWVRKCASCGILRKEGREYVKVAESPE